MLPFHIFVHPQLTLQQRYDPVTLNGHELRAIRLTAADLSKPLPVTFDAAAERLRELHRLFFEPDGSFVWVSQKGPQDWQVDGQLNDAGVNLQNVELRGTCPVTEFQRLLQALGWPESSLVFQLVREGIVLDDAEFTRVFLSP